MIAAYKKQAIDRMGGRLRAALKRCDPPLSDSLRLMAVQLVKEALVKGYQGHTEVHPGLKKLAQWGKCSERQARRNMRVLENWGLAVPVGGGKARRATEYWIEPESIIRVMMTLGANPHPDLMAEIRDFQADIRGDIRGDISGGHLAGHMSPRYIESGNVTQSLRRGGNCDV